MDSHHHAELELCAPFDAFSSDCLRVNKNYAKSWHAEIRAKPGVEVVGVTPERVSFTH
jgi:hypothetical protein